jgi:hypothetical protein
VVPGPLGGLNEEAPGLRTNAPSEGSAPHQKTNVMTQPLPRFHVESAAEPRVRRQLAPDRRLLTARCRVEMEA